MNRIHASRSLAENIKRIIKSIPYGRVCTYGQIAALAGNYRAARQVAWVLHSSSEKDRLPWHRVVNKRGRISLSTLKGYALQKSMLRKEGIRFDCNDTINLERYLWNPENVSRQNTNR